MPLKESGFELIKNFVASDIASLIIKETDIALLESKGGGIRNTELKFTSIKEFASSEYLFNQAARYLEGKPFLVRAILFDKSPESNWLVTWHQDKTIAVSSKFEAKDWGPWSIKGGIHHVQPPLEVLEDMVTFRIHLDESTIKSGCLKVIPKSHAQGILSQDQVYAYSNSHEVMVLNAPALSALVMRPHLLHASSKATEPSRRRILHLEYSSYKLPNGVQWT